jgi:hypothetical protein
VRGVRKTRVIELRDIPKEQATNEVLEYYKAHKEAYPSEVAEALRIDYEMVWEITDLLKSQGRLEVLE